jgi:hypothetical protein
MRPTHHRRHLHRNPGEVERHPALHLLPVLTLFPQKIWNVLFFYLYLQAIVIIDCVLLKHWQFFTLLWNTFIDTKDMEMKKAVLRQFITTKW